MGNPSRRVERSLSLVSLVTRIRERVRLSDNRVRLAVLVTMALVLAIVVPPLLQALMIPVPDLYRERGVRWGVYVEEPVSINEVEPILTVFSGQVERILGIPVHGTVYERLPDDGRFSYLSTDHAAGVGSGGPVDVPVYILTGYGWSPAHGKVAAWATSAARTVPRSGSGLLTGFAHFYDPGNFTLRLTPNRVSRNLDTFLHEFAHLLGLRDLYPSNRAGIEGCEDLPLLMNGLGGLPVYEVEYPVARPVLSGLIGSWTGQVWAGVDGGVPVLGHHVAEANWDVETNVLRVLLYTISEMDGSRTVLNVAVHTWELDHYRDVWTVEELDFLGIIGSPAGNCPQEFESP